TLPKKMVEDVSELRQESRRQTEESKRQTEEQVKQTQHLENQTLSLKKMDAWDSDPGNKFKRDLDEIKALAIAMGLKVENIDRVIDRLQRDRDTPKVTLEVVNQQDNPDHQEVKDSDNKANQLMRGALKSPRHKLLAAHPHTVIKAPPPQWAWIPQKLDMWGNDQYGDCVTAEEAFAKATYQPEIFIPTATVTAWASKHGVLNGADLSQVMDMMQNDGFVVGSQQYNDGKYSGVDYSNETVLQSAISQGPVKIAIDANALPSGAGNNQGWYSLGHGNFPNTDHCVALCGYGPAGWLYQQLGVPLPSALSASQPGYLLYTWSTIGFVDHKWIMSTCVEAWVRNP